MTSMQVASDRSVPKRRPMTAREWLRTRAWRHAVAWIAVALALLPVLWVVSAAFTAKPTITSGSIIPRDPTLENFSILISNPDQPYLRWS